MYPDDPASLWMADTVTGGKGSLTQEVHCESIASSETMCPHFTQRVHAGYFLKVPINSPLENPPGKVWVLCERTHQFAPNLPGRPILGVF